MLANLQFYLLDAVRVGTNNAIRLPLELRRFYDREYKKLPQVQSELWTTTERAIKMAFEGKEVTQTLREELEVSTSFHIPPFDTEC